ncbi:hypothetical protein CLIB1423_14S02982 [[Candida] railenensis]|uniref:Uncharacterized protein n=1 Tax=[Candida] railenensis TaxID=45579 RepID=A0A9P0QRF3_9ASCO|nr:hypothetical protein CLIB1423_14S02982 [[Candida] railenensis]
MDNRRIESFEEFFNQIESSSLNDESGPFCPQDLQCISSTSQKYGQDLQNGMGITHSRFHRQRRVSLSFLPFCDLNSTIAIPCCSGLDDKEFDSEDLRKKCESPAKKSETRRGKESKSKHAIVANTRTNTTPHNSTETSIVEKSTAVLAAGPEIHTTDPSLIIGLPESIIDVEQTNIDESDEQICFSLGRNSLILNTSPYEEYRKHSICSMSSVSDTEESEEVDVVASSSNLNPIVPDLFPKMDLDDDEQFMKFNKLPLTPAYVSK